MNALYEQTVKRLARTGIKDPTAQIIALAEEIERYRDKIRCLEEKLRQEEPQRKDGQKKVAPFRSKFRYTKYDRDLDRFVVPLLYKLDGTAISFIVKTGETYTTEGIWGKVYVGKEPDIVYGEVIDRLAELENQMEE